MAGCGAIALAGAALAFGLESQVRQSIVLEISACGALGVSGNPRPLIIGPGSAGGMPADAADDSTELRYTSAVGRGARRVIVAQWESGDAAPAGCSLRLTVKPAGTGAEGSSAGEILLSEGPQVVITGIGSCATGIQPGAGAKLFYRLSVENPALLSSGESKGVNVVFTLMDAS
jgi:hypothetical protein